MFLKISYSEIQSVIQAKTKLDIAIERFDDQTINVGKQFSIMGLTQNLFLMKLRVEEMSGANVVLAHDNPILVKEVMKIVEVELPELVEILELHSEDSVVLHLGKVKALEKVFELVSLDGICFLPKGAVVELTTR